MMRRAALVILSLALFVPLFADAHVTGASFEQQVNGYTVDSGYSNPAPQVGESVIFDFRLRKGQDDVPFDDVWVKVEAEDKSVVFASGLYNAEFGGPRMSYVFPRAGNYTIDMRYENKSGAIVETSYPVTVIPSASRDAAQAPGNIMSYLYGLAGFAAGAALAFVVLKKPGSKKKTP